MKRASFSSFRQITTLIHGLAIAVAVTMAQISMPARGQAPATGQSADVGPPVVLRVGGTGGFRLPDKNSTVPRYRADRAVVDAFEKEHPNIEVENGNGLNIQGPAAESGILLQFAGGTAPDVVYVNFRQSATFIKEGFLQPLDAYVKQDPSVWQGIDPMVQKVLIDVGHGHIYSIPYAQFVLALYYRKDYFAAAGLDPNKPPATWDEFYTDCTRLTDQKNGVWGFEFDNDASYWWVDFLWQAGGEVIKRNAAGQWEAAFNTPQGVAALEFYKKLMDDPYVGRDGKTYLGVAHRTADYSKDAQMGDLAMWFQYQSNIVANMTDASALNPNIMGIAPMPKGPTGITANEVNAAMWGMSSQITDPRVRDAAWKFISFMGSDEANRIRTKTFVEAGLGNTVNPVSLKKYGYSDYTTPESKEWLAANEQLMQHGHPEPYGDNMSQIYNLLNVPLGEIELNPHADPKKLLDRCAAEVNEKLTGYVDPRVMAQRRFAAWIVFVVVMLVGGVVFFRYVRDLVASMLSAFTVDADTNRAVARGPQRHVVAWLFMLPALLTVLVWAYYPLAHGLVIAFQNYHIIGRTTWVGLDNFIDAFHEHNFWVGLWASFLFTVYSLILGFALPIFLALALSEIPVGKMFFRTLYYMPAITAGLIVGFVWKQFESDTPPGLLDKIVTAFSGGRIPPIKWLLDPRWALLATVLPRVWASAGPGTILYLAALKGVSEEMYEAAEIDGAGIWTKIWCITLPTLKPLILINLIGAVIGAFQATDTILIMTGGGPVGSTQTLGLEIFYNAFLYLKFGYATAVAWIMGSFLVGFTLSQLRIMKDLKFTAGNA